MRARCSSGLENRATARLMVRFLVPPPNLRGSIVCTDELIVHIVNLPHRGRVGASKEDSFNLRNPDAEKRVDTRPSHLFYWSRSSAGQSNGFLNRGSHVRVMPRSPLGFSDSSLCCFVDLNYFNLMIKFIDTS